MPSIDASAPKGQRGASSAFQALVVNAAITAIASPPAACPGCLADAGVPWPEGTTSRFCATHAARMFTRRGAPAHHNADEE